MSWLSQGARSVPDESTHEEARVHEVTDGIGDGGGDGASGARQRGSVTIDCSTCCARGTAACDDCLVTAVLSRPPGAVELEAEEREAVERLQRAGLVPLVRYRPAS